MICDQAEYSETESKQPATETWSMARLDSSVFDHGGKMYQLLTTTGKCRKMQKEKRQLQKLVSPRELSLTTRACTKQYFDWRHFFEVNGISFIVWSMIKIRRGF